MRRSTIAPTTPCQRAVVGSRSSPAPIRAEDHHALEADVDHAGALGPEPAETGQRDRDGRRDRGSRRVPEESRSLLPVTTRAKEMSANAISSQAQTGIRRGRPPAARVGREGSLRRHAEHPGSAGASCSATELLLEPQPVAAHDLVGDHDGEHEDALGDRHDVGGDVGEDLQRVALLVEEGEQQRAEARCRPGGCGRAARPRCRRSRARTGTSSRRLWASPNRMRQADQPRDPAGDEHRRPPSSASRRSRWPPRRWRTAPVARRSKPKRVRFEQEPVADAGEHRHARRSRRPRRRGRCRAGCRGPGCPRGSAWWPRCCCPPRARRPGAGSRRPGTSRWS